MSGLFKKLKGRIYRQQNSRIIDASLAYLHSYIGKGASVLDIGSGTGWIAEKIHDTYQADVTCLDVVDNNRTNLYYEIFNGVDIPFKDKSLDVSMLFYVLHHASQPNKLLEEAIRVLKPNGKIIIQEDVPENFFDIFSTKVHIFIYDLWNKTHSSSFFLSDKKWQELFKKHNLRLVDKKIIPNLVVYPKSYLYVLEKN